MKGALAVCVAALLAVTADARADQLDTLAAAEALRLNQLYATSAIIQVVSSGQTDSTPDGLVTLSRAEIDGIVAQAQITDPAIVRRFVIGHEMAHQLQFRIYGRNVLYRGLDERKVLECQADMLSGANLLTNEPLNQDRNAALADVIRVAFMVGSENYSPVDHPDHEQRRLATKLGLALGTLRAMQTLSDAQRNRPLEAEIARKIDLRPNESAEAWSLRLARRVVHYQREAVAALSAGDPDISWNTSAEHPVVTYSLPYTNASSRPIHVEMEVVSMMVGRFDKSDTSKWDRYDVANYVFDLAPGQTRAVSGELRWYADAERMPKLLYPPDTQTLFDAMFAQAGPSTSTPLTSPPRFQDPPTNAAAEEMSGILHRLVNQSDGCFARLRPSSIADRVDTGDGDYSDTYPTAFAIPGTTKVTIWQNSDGTCRISSNVHEGRSKDGALTAYNEFKATLFAALHANSEELLNSKGLPFTDFPIANGWSASLSVSSHKVGGSDSYTVSLYVEKSN
jgi:hypothetical protein